MDWESVSTIVGAVTGSQVLTTWIQGRANKKKTDADAASQLASSMLDWTKALTERITSLEQMIHDKDQIIDDLRERIVHLEILVSKFGASNASISPTNS